MKQILIDRYGPPEEVARCAQVPDVGAPAAGEVVFDVLAFRSTRPTFRSVAAPTGSSRRCRRHRAPNAWAASRPSVRACRT